MYDSTAKNVTRAKLVNDLVEGAYGGIPFLIPQNDNGVMWNHVLRWRGTSWQFSSNPYQITTEGRAVLTTVGIGDQQMAYELPAGSPEQFAKSPVYWQIRLLNVGLPLRAGGAIVGNNNIDGSKDQAWVYLAGQRYHARKRRYYCDEDTWNCVLADRWDSQGQLWKTLWMQSFVAPDLPGTVVGAFGHNDLLSGNGLEPLRQLSDEVFLIPGLDRVQMTSL